MNYSVEIPVWVKTHDEDELEIHDLEVTFDLALHTDRLTRYAIDKITGYFVDGSPVLMEEIRKENPFVDKQIERALDHFIGNYDEYDENDKDWDRYE